MGKHEQGYARVEDDLYTTCEPFIVDALAKHYDLRNAWVWECACGRGDMAMALRRHGASVYETDVVDRGDQDATLDFLVDPAPSFSGFDLNFIITNPPGGPRNQTAAAFIERGLTYVASHGVTLALLLPADFDSAVTRRHLFAECKYFTASIVLTRRPVWFARQDGKRAAPNFEAAGFRAKLDLLRRTQGVVEKIDALETEADKRGDRRYFVAPVAIGATF